MTNQEKLAILRSWYLIEMLSPNGLKIEKKMLQPDVHLKANYDHTEPLPELPWEKREQELNLSIGEEEEDAEPNESPAEEPVSSGDDSEKEEGYIFYLGIVSLSEVYAAIREKLDFQDSFLDGERSKKDYCAFASVRVSLEGRPVQDSLTISTVPWYLGRIRALGLERVLAEPVGRDFEKFASTFRQAVFARLGDVFSAKDLKELTEAVISECDAGGPPLTYVFAGKREKYDPLEPPGLLNSFFHEDVADAMGLLGDGKLPPLFDSLFAQSERRLDISVGADLQSVIGRKTCLRSAWPSVSGKLALMQHAAVVAAGSDEARRIVTVNGPPGTGKTTLLRSFIAENIVKRAERLCAFVDPSNAWKRIRGETECEGAIYAPASDIVGFEMVVSSNNNGAIENITKDIPLEESVKGYEDVVAEIDHFATVALNIANYKRKASREVVRTWGLIAAVLGSKDKRKKFIKPLLSEADPERTDGVETIGEFARKSPSVHWNDACAAFKESLLMLRRRMDDADDRDVAWLQLDVSERQLFVPHVDDEVQRLQIEVFLKALVLHRAFVLATWSQFSRNLTAWARLALRPLATDLKRDEISAVWQSFFLLCPVISTTFASARRMLGGIPWSTFGWALIDEAGQASPQAATGVLLRCRRALIVGDPLQLEPIVTLSPGLIRLIVETYSANPKFVSSPENGESLQTVADRCSVHGTLRKMKEPDGSEREEWIGVPLLVHRRCLEPMFSMSNKIYHDQMISAVAEPANVADKIPLGNSTWIQQPGSAHPHAVAEQIDLALEMILMLFGYYNKRKEVLNRSLLPSLTKNEKLAAIRPWREPSLSVIAPFRQIEEELTTRLEHYPSLSRFVEYRIGTIHKFQGKESEAVILILGLDGSSAGAAAFATKKPNMMNVAVTRAKHRLYVIGDSHVWGSQPYFGDVYREMKRREAVRTGDEFLAAMRASVQLDPRHLPMKKTEKSTKGRSRRKASENGQKLKRA